MSPASTKRRDSFSALSTVAEEADEDRSDTASEAQVSLFSHAEPESMILPEAPTNVPPILIPAKNPRLYELVQMSSFWWDSADSNDSADFAHAVNTCPPEMSVAVGKRFRRSAVQCGRQRCRGWWPSCGGGRRSGFTSFAFSFLSMNSDESGFADFSEWGATFSFQAL
jgi:hypothetical protein